MNDKFPGGATQWIVAALLVSTAARSAAALDIQNGDYSRKQPRLVRVMTWNVFQRLGDPTEPNTPWTSSQTGSPQVAIGLIVEALDPDILLFQEIGDIDNSVSYAAALSSLQLWRNTYRPGFQVLLSPDGGNIHNAILSRWPFSELNGDSLSTYTDIPNLQQGSGSWPAGGDGGIRGWLQAEINLPDASYAGDLYIGCSHFKAGGGFNDERVVAAKNIAAYILYGLNAGADPLHLIPDVAQPPAALSPVTPVIWGGDINTAGSNEPADILRSNNPSSATDGPDRDGSSVWRSDTASAYNGTLNTYQTGSRLDWLFVQDSIARVDAAFIFDTGRMPKSGNIITQGAPASFIGLAQNAQMNTIASDHFPVIVDVELPATIEFQSVTIGGQSSINSGGFGQYQGVAHYTDGSQQTVTFQGEWSVTGPASISRTGLLSADNIALDAVAEVSFTYTDGVTHSASRQVSILTNCDRSGDINADGLINALDVPGFIEAFLDLPPDVSTQCRANMNDDQTINQLDVQLFVSALLGAE